MMYTSRQEASVTQSIITQLGNLNWIVDEKDPRNNVTQQRAKTEEQKKKLKGKFPDFVLYQEGTTTPIAVIEAKRPNESLTKALDQAETRYARPLGAPLVFAYNDTYVATRYLHNNRPLKIDGEDVRQFIDHYHSLRFVQEGAEILSAPARIQHSREQLIGIFKRAANLLREAGLTAGAERFSVFSDLLFLKIMDEVSDLALHAGDKSPIAEHIRWSHFANMSAPILHTYLKDVVWREMNTQYGAVFGDSLQIDSPEITNEIVRELSQLNLTASDTDVKGDAFEYFLKNAYQGLSIKDLGEYFTPRNIVRVMVSMVNPRLGDKIYDPFCGTGGFLIESFRYLRVRMRGTDAKMSRVLRTETVFGSEITSNARIAKMNMILFGDGHNNIVKEDSLAHPKHEKFDVVLTNPPYSQRSRYGNLYPIDTPNADALCALHCFDSLKPDGRAALLVKEDFLSEGGAIGKVRDYIFKNSRNFSIVSLPRKLFEPYTPTKTSIVYFEKNGTRDTTYFYVVKKVGTTLGARKKSIPQNDLPLMLDAFNYAKKSSEIDSAVVKNSAIEANDCGLWVYDYEEVVPPFPYPVEYLGKYIKEIHEPIRPSKYPDQEFLILGVSSKQGVFENDVILGKGSRQTYKRAYAGNIVYNAHRANIGSFGIVPPELDGGYISSNYVVFQITDPNLPAHLVLALLKSPAYRKVIEAYDTKQGAVRANLSYEQLCRIKIPLLPDDKMNEVLGQLQELTRMEQEVQVKQQAVASYLQNLSGEQRKNGSDHRTIKKPAKRAMTAAVSTAKGNFEQTFRALADQWYRETGPLSSTTKKAMHPAYQRIIGMGVEVIPLILRELRSRPSYWFWALNALTGADPAKGETTFDATVKAWLTWGAEQKQLKPNEPKS